MVVFGLPCSVTGGVSVSFASRLNASSVLSAAWRDPQLCETTWRLATWDVVVLFRNLARLADAVGVLVVGLVDVVVVFAAWACPDIMGSCGWVVIVCGVV